MYITATISTIATAGIVASEQADTALVSEVKAETASILADTGTDGVVVASLATDSITAAALKADAVTEIQNGLATAAALTTISGEIAAVKAETASILEDTGTTIPGTITTIDNEVAVIDGIVDAILADTNELQTDLTDGGRLDLLIDAIKTETASILEDTGTDGVVLTAGAVDAILDEVVVGTYTMRQLLTVFASALAGKLSGGGTTTLTFRGINDASDVIVATVDANGNRSDLTITV